MLTRYDDILIIWVTYLLQIFSILKYHITPALVPSLSIFMMYYVLTLKAIPRTTSSVFAPSGGAASPWADSPNEEDVDILEEFEEPASTASAEATLENSTEDDDKGGAEDTEGLLELDDDDVELPFESIRWGNWCRVVTSNKVDGGWCRRSRCCSRAVVGLVCTEADSEDAEAPSAAFTAASVEDIR